MRGLSRFSRLAALSRFITIITASVLTLIVTGCATTQTAKVERFNQAAAVDVELRFFRWDSIYMTKPDTRENGFLPLLNTTQISNEINRRNLKRGVAAVVVGYSYDEAQTTAICEQWKKFLASQNFKRVVLLRAGGGKTIDGLPIIQDLAITPADATPGFNPATIATLPTAPGADVKNPPIASSK